MPSEPVRPHIAQRRRHPDQGRSRTHQRRLCAPAAARQQWGLSAPHEGHTMSDRRGVPVSKAEVESMLEGARRGIGQALGERLRGLESGNATKALDVEAYDAMAELAERLDRAEAQLADMVEHGIRYRGYWSHGTKAARGDCVTH